MSHSFELHIGKERSRLILLEDGSRRTSREWPESRDMGRQLVEAIEEILAEVGIRPTDVSMFDVESDVSDNFTSVRIAHSVAATYEFGASFSRGSNDDDRKAGSMFS